MPAYNFKKQFADAVESGQKRQTIRLERSRPTVPGDTLYLYTGMRTRSCRKLMETACVDVQDVSIYSSGGVRVGGQRLDDGQANEFAKSDGFASRDEFLDFFREHYGLPYRGVVIKW